MLRLCRVIVLCSMIFFTTVQTIQAEPLPEKERQKLFKESKVSLTEIAAEASEGTTSVKKNGVKLAIKVKTVSKKDTTDIEVGWTLSYSGPRSPLIIVKPTFLLPTGQTKVTFFAFAKGKEYGFPFTMMSPQEVLLPSGRFLLTPYLEEKVLPIHPELSAYKPMLRTKDWFISIPKGKSVQGKLVISGKEFKKHLMRLYPGEFDSKTPPRLFLELTHDAKDRGEDYGLDAWTGELVLPCNKVPELSQW